MKRFAAGCKLTGEGGIFQEYLNAPGGDICPTVTSWSGRLESLRLPFGQGRLTPPSSPGPTSAVGLRTGSGSITSAGGRITASF